MFSDVKDYLRLCKKEMNKMKKGRERKKQKIKAKQGLEKDVLE